MIILYGFLLAITILLSVQLHLMKKLSQSQKNTNSNEVDKGGKDISKDDDKENESEDEKGKDNPDQQNEKKKYSISDDSVDISNKEKVLAAICNRKKEVMEEDLYEVMKELETYFSDFANGNYFEDLKSNDYYGFIDLRKNTDQRIVVLGDIHCDYTSLAAALLKLSVSDYDYFGKACFVFLGDYMDRGGVLFETLLLLMDLKRILGDRMIMLKGNHESIEYNDEKQEMKPRVKPHETVDCLNQFCKSNKKFMKRFADFYGTLPTYVYVKTNNRNMLLTHASIPRDVFIQQIRFDENDGSLAFESDVQENNRLAIRNRVFKDMIWGDPSKYEEKIQVDGRFEFGSKQFDRWMSRNHIDLLLRSHEEARFGYEPMFGKRLYTLFSTGGEQNPQTGYPNVEPAMGIIRNDSLDIENSFLYKIRKSEGGLMYVNLLTKQKYTEKQIEHYKMGDEFVCTKQQCSPIREILKMFCADNAQEEND